MIECLAVAADDGTVYSSFQLKTFEMKPASVPKAMILRKDKNSLSEAAKSMQEIVRNRYVYQKALLDEVVYNILYTASDKPLKERVNFRMLDNDIRNELQNNGINIPYHFTVSTTDGREVYRCPDYEEKGKEFTYSQVLFHNDPQSKMGIVRIHFPEMSSYIFSSVRFMIPSIIFTIVLLITFLFTIIVIFRQKRYSEIKNDFINNMTHELKTPIASISLAAQMMNDDSVPKTEQMTRHLGAVISDESKRLRFLVEKVLQMSMFDKKSIVFKKKELDLNEMVEQIAQTFSLRVEHTGGKIYTEIEAVDSAIYVDEVHFQNAITNLMDNAVKYRKPDERNKKMNKKKMFKGFAIAAIMLVIGIIIVLVSGGFAGLVSSVGTALATLGIEQTRRTIARRHAKGQVTNIGSASYDKENKTSDKGNSAFDEEKNLLS